MNIVLEGKGEGNVFKMLVLETNCVSTVLSLIIATN